MFSFYIINHDVRIFYDRGDRVLEACAAGGAGYDGSAPH
jgi:hypothetical protein